MTWDAFRQRVRHLRGEALGSWPPSVSEVRLHNVRPSGLPGSNAYAGLVSSLSIDSKIPSDTDQQEQSFGVHVWCSCTAPARGLRKSTLMHCSIPAGASPTTTSDPGVAGSGKEAEEGGSVGVVHVPIAMLRSVWMDGECNVSASYTSPSLLRALKGSAIEHMLWPDDGDGDAHPAGEPSIVIVADKGQQWTQARIDYRTAADAHMWFSECARGDDNADCGRHEGDWYYIRGGRRGRFVAFVRGRNVVVYDTLVRKDTQLTWAAAEGVQYGAVDLPMEEELGRTTGIFWAPPSTQAPAVDMLLCARVDERAVLEVGLPELPVESKINPLATLVSNPTALFASEAYGWSSGCQSTGAADKRAGGQLTEHLKYPRPGTPNAVTDWVVAEIEHSPGRGIFRRRVRALSGRFRIQAAFPWCEYVVRAGWLPAADHAPDAVWLQLLDRAQKRTAIVRVPLACFDGGTEQPVDLLLEPRPAECGAGGVGAGDARIDVLYEERQPGGWINLSHGLRFLGCSTRDCVRFTMATERTNGYCHLHLVSSHIQPPHAGDRSGAGNEGVVACARMSVVALTGGEWPVTSDDSLFVDERRQLVYFCARRPNPLTANLFAASYAHALQISNGCQAADNVPPAPWQLTMMGYSHSSFAFDSTGVYFSCQSSNLSTPTRHCVYQINHSKEPGRRAVTAQCLAVLEPYCHAAMLGAQGALADVAGGQGAVLRVPSARVAKRLSGSSTASSMSVRSMSMESLAADEYFVERLISKIRASGQQIQHSALASDLAKLKRLTPAYVSQRVTKAVKSALPFCSAPTIAPLHLLQGGFFQQVPPTKEKEREPMWPRALTAAKNKPQPAQPPAISHALKEQCAGAQRGTRIAGLPLFTASATSTPMAQCTGGLPRRTAGRVLGSSHSSQQQLRSSLTAATLTFIARETLLGTHNTDGLLELCRGGNPVPRLFCFPVPQVGGGSNSGEYDLLFGHVYLPPDFTPGQLYPVIVNAYGGPQCQLVSNAFAYPRHRRLAMLTRMAPGTLSKDTAAAAEYAPPADDSCSMGEDDGDRDSLGDWTSLYTRPPSLAVSECCGSNAENGAARRSGTRSLYASAEAALEGAAIAEAARQPVIAEASPDLGGCCAWPLQGQAQQTTGSLRPMVVICIDGRGTPFRGLRFESAIRGRLGRIEVDDIASALDYLCEYGLDCLTPTTRSAPRWCRNAVSTTSSDGAEGITRPPVLPPPSVRAQQSAGACSDWDSPPSASGRCHFVDRTRVAIHGWSYGGYVALRAMASHPSLFRVAVAGAPVVRWDWYSAAYIERYLGVHLPLTKETDGGGQAEYAQASVTAMAAQLAVNVERILLVHGWGDDNVHVAHTAELLRELRRHTSRPANVAVYANERHGLRLPASNEHYETLLAFWLLRSLQS